MKSSWRSIAAGVAMAGALSALAAPPAIEAFFKPAEWSGATLSPDGKRLAIVYTAAGQRGKLIVVDLADAGKKSRAVAGFDDLDVGNIHWVNDHRLVYSLWDGNGSTRLPIWPGLWAVDDNGEHNRRLAYNADAPSTTGTQITDRTLPWNWTLHEVLRDGSDDVIVADHLFDASGQPVAIQPMRLDTRNGAKRSVVDNPPDHAFNWWIDPGGKVIAVETTDKGKSRLLVPDGGGWRTLSEGNAYTNAGKRLQALTAYVPGYLFLVAGDPDHKSDTEVLARLDLAKPDAPPEALVALPDFDFAGWPVVDAESRRLLGVQFESDAWGSYWFDAKLKALQGEIDKQLPTTVNMIDCNNCSDALLVVASSDRQPPVYYRFDRAEHKLTPLINSRPWIDPAQMGRREFLRFRARDGMEIPVMITHPPGPARGKRPAVVLVHGGPWVRGTHWAEWSWHAEAQFLASRGYVVIEPEFRGSTGYGDKLFRASFKQWGRAMQDDVSDAMDFAVAKGWVDPKRVCIGGASYGGYATLMGLAKEPDRYRCGFEWVGVTDIELMYSIGWSDSTNDWKDYGMPQMIGDRDKDADQLAATSPIRLAARIDKPLLLAYGGEDRRVPLKHGEAFRDAVKVHNDEVDWVVYPNEGHGWRALETNVDFWTRVEKLLARTIGPASP
ncbi:MAG: S9 family peptidase [Pelomonas sp.]|nr:S9 family peptidase [Roseateles sp.]